MNGNEMFLMLRSAVKISDPSATNLLHNPAMGTTSLSQAPAITDQTALHLVTVLGFFLL